MLFFSHHLIDTNTKVPHIKILQYQLLQFVADTCPQFYRFRLTIIQYLVYLYTFFHNLLLPGPAQAGPDFSVLFYLHDSFFSLLYFAIPLFTFMPVCLILQFRYSLFCLLFPCHTLTFILAHSFSFSIPATSLFLFPLVIHPLPHHIYFRIYSPPD